MRRETRIISSNELQNVELIVQGAGWGDRAGRASAEARCSDEQKSAEDKRNEIHLRALQLFHHFGAV